MNIEEFNLQQGKTLRCKYCDSLDLYIKKVPPHIGVYCNNCERWNTWLKQNPVELAVIPDPPTPPLFKNNPISAHCLDKTETPRYLPNQLSHPVNLEERVAALEHDLSILCQLLVRRTDG